MSTHLNAFYRLALSVLLTLALPSAAAHADDSNSPAERGGPTRSRASARITDSDLRSLSPLTNHAVTDQYNKWERMMETYLDPHLDSATLSKRISTVGNMDFRKLKARGLRHSVLLHSDRGGVIAWNPQTFDAFSAYTAKVLVVFFDLYEKAPSDEIKQKIFLAFAVFGKRNSDGWAPNNDVTTL